MPKKKHLAAPAPASASEFMWFGKFRGRHITRLPHGYLMWLLGQFRGDVSPGLRGQLSADARLRGLGSAIDRPVDEDDEIRRLIEAGFRSLLSWETTVAIEEVSDRDPQWAREVERCQHLTRLRNYLHDLIDRQQRFKKIHDWIDEVWDDTLSSGLDLDLDEFEMSLREYVFEIRRKLANATDEERAALEKLEDLIRSAFMDDAMTVLSEEGYSQFKSRSFRKRGAP